MLVKAIRLATVVYKDPVGTDNAYRFIQYVNDAKEKTIFIADDDLRHGRRIGIAAIFYSDKQNKLKPGNKPKIEMYV